MTKRLRLLGWLILPVGLVVASPSFATTSALQAAASPSVQSTNFGYDPPSTSTTHRTNTEYYERAGDDLVALLADIEIEPDGGTLDQTAWDDWRRCLRAVKGGEPTE